MRLDIKVTQQKTGDGGPRRLHRQPMSSTELTVGGRVTIKQGTTTHAQGTDYKVVGDEIDWSLAVIWLPIELPGHLTSTSPASPQRTDRHRFKVTGVV